jgi:hypothetical protein
VARDSYFVGLKARYNKFKWSMLSGVKKVRRMRWDEIRVSSLKPHPKLETEA